MILFPRARRRRPGIYLYRTRRHLRRGAEWGYVGKSRMLGLRADCHEGRCTRHPACAGGKPWSDLIKRKYEIRLPWWLGWDWITLSLETIVIWTLRPRYNWQKNPRRSKVPPSVQVLQRAARGGYRAARARPLPMYRPRLHWVPALAITMIVTGLIGAWLTR